SMDWDILTKVHWHRYSYTSGDNRFQREIKHGLYRDDIVGVIGNEVYNRFSYIHSNADNVFSSHCAGSSLTFSLTLELCNDVVQNYDWRIKSSGMNILYYNPDITYSPWVTGDGKSLSLANFSAVKSNPETSSIGYDIQRNLEGFIYHVWTDSHGFSGDKPKSGSVNKTIGANQLVDWWDEHKRYTVNSSSITIHQITYSGRVENTPSLIATLTGSGNHALLGGKTIQEAQQNIANWYQYFRKRSFVAKSAIAKVISQNPSYRYGLNFINNTSFPYKNSTENFIEFPTNTGSQAHNTGIISSLFRLKWPSGSTPLRKGLDRAGRYFNNTDNHVNPIIESCQKNFTILFTDGYWNQNAPTTNIGDSDRDGKSVTVADIAHHYYTNDLSPLNGKQTMSTFTVSFGLKGLLEDTDNDGWPDNPTLLSYSNWGDPDGDDKPEKIDDLWHAAFNSDGLFVSAETPEEVASALADVLAEIGNRMGSASAASFSTTTLTADSAVFLAQFDTSNSQWSGDVKSFLLDNKGQLSSSPQWSASDKLNQMSSSNRRIFTYNETLHKGVPFSWNELSTLQQDDLRINPDGTSSTDNNDAKAKARLEFLRGNRQNEVSRSGAKRGTYSFRYRLKLLGDIIHSAPIFIGSPELFWPNTAPFPTNASQSYNSFKIGQAKSRQGMVYTGANDGFLHGFNSSNGQEVFAYMPNNIFSNDTSTSRKGVHYLTDTNYAHRYYVDMPLTVSDVYIKKGNEAKKWRTILMGGGRKGSRGLFALDVTDPTKFNQTSTNARNLVLWEFDQNDDANLGLTFSQPSIARMNNGRWAAIFGNGYNNQGDGTASLFIVFLDGGANGTWVEGTDYLNITTKVGSNQFTDCQDCNGLSTPQVVDINGDQVMDRIYAGDLQGNLWAFDVSASNAQQWKVAYGNANTPKPLFIAKQNNKTQAITLKPIVVKHPEVSGGNPDILVFFGTGQYLTATDPANSDLQSFYGVWDKGEHSITPSALVEQTFLSGSFRNNNKDVTNEVRVLTDTTVDYSTKKGWVINLSLASGERVIVDPDIRGDLLFFNTWIPDSSPCGQGGSGFLMSVKQINGGRTQDATFDLNDDVDGKVDADDLVVISGQNETYAPSGQVFNLGLPASSSFLNNQQYTPGTNAPQGSTNPPIHTRPIAEIDG
ncbi:MAG: hypothetical protein KAG26_06210, partial [Methylococcales bacterium]|nr:hypothetical protein [Methylococcales bacterium]